MYQCLLLPLLMCVQVVLTLQGHAKAGKSDPGGARKAAILYADTYNKVLQVNKQLVQQITAKDKTDKAFKFKLAPSQTGGRAGLMSPPLHTPGSVP